MLLLFLLLLTFSSCEAFHQQQSFTIISSRTRTSDASCITTYAAATAKSSYEVLGSIYLQSWIIKDLKRCIKEETSPPRGLLSKLKRKQDCIEYLLTEYPECYQDTDPDVDLLIQEYLSAKEEDRMAILKEELVEILIALASSDPGWYDEDDIRYSEEEVREYQQDIEKIEQALNEREGTTEPEGVVPGDDCLNAFDDSTGRYDEKSIQYSEEREREEREGKGISPEIEGAADTPCVDAGLGDECLWEMQVAPGYEASDNTFVFKNKADGSFLVPTNLRDGSH